MLDMKCLCLYLIKVKHNDIGKDSSCFRRTQTEGGVKLCQQLTVILQVSRPFKKVRNGIEPLQFGGISLALEIVFALMFKAKLFAKVVSQVELEKEWSISRQKQLLILAFHFEELAEKQRLIKFQTLAAFHTKPIMYGIDESSFKYVFEVPVR